ncbi:DUF975 family protein [Marinilactibacillus kalidii]|uniref:DUF975 family protein n=1 Tax=Marinilactibacillus kalidii TaxID=2820274 RepID=UPI001ABDD075|nr:DUF975 family protein [Marinilactibacillus kalidii]
MLSVGEIKREARQTLNGRWKEAALLNVIPVVITILIVGSGSFAFGYFGTNIFNGDYINGLTETDGTAAANAREWLSDLLTIVFATGVSYTLLDMVRNPNYEIVPLRDSLQVIKKGYTLPVLGMFILQWLFVSLWAILFVIPGLIKIFSYALTYFVYKDATESGHYLSPLDCITRSRELMDGNKGRLFLLELSFIGWHLVGTFTLGLGYLFITPYLAASRAIFYEDLLRSR